MLSILASDSPIIKVNATVQMYVMRKYCHYAFERDQYILCINHSCGYVFLRFLISPVLSLLWAMIAACPVHAVVKRIGHCIHSSLSVSLINGDDLYTEHQSERKEASNTLYVI